MCKLQFTVTIKFIVNILNVLLYEDANRQPYIKAVLFFVLIKSIIRISGWFPILYSNSYTY